jgi:hypothetical protein
MDASQSGPTFTWIEERERDGAAATETEAL